MHFEAGGSTTIATLNKPKQSYEREGVTLILEGKAQGVYYDGL